MRRRDLANQLLMLSSLVKRDAQGTACARVTSVGEPRTSIGGWKYRTLSVQDESMNALLQIDENKYLNLNLKPNDYVLCKVKSRGIDNEGILTVLFQNNLSVTETSKLVSSLRSELAKIKDSQKKVKKGPTVWQFHAREARGLLDN